MPTQFEEGLLLGLLVGEGHFGGDGRQPQVTLRMHERHEALFRWLERTFPGSRLYGPYEHSGRRYYQWMARGAYLREELVPTLRRTLSPTLDRYAHGRFQAMCARYSRQLGVHAGSPSALEDTGPRSSAPAERPAESSGSELEPGPAGVSEGRAAEIFAALRDTSVPADGN